MPAYDALLVVSFGGPEQPDDVLPFLERVTRGRPIPRPRLLAVAEHYHHFGGRSPINGHCRALIAALDAGFAARGLKMPIYWGNRNWHPLLEATLAEMTRDGVRHALAFVTSAYSSYSACRQYLDDIERARLAAGPAAPVVEKIGQFHANPGFIGPNVEAVSAALARAPGAALLFTAHSLPVAMAATSKYVEQLNETCALVARGVGRTDYRLVYQSRSGSPAEPWLGPDILEALSELKQQGAAAAVVSPVGFISDHMEVVYDLDVEAAAHAAQLGLTLVRAATAGTHPRFVSMIVDLVQARLADPLPADPCRLDCCPAPVRPPAAPAAPRTP